MKHMKSQEFQIEHGQPIPLGVNAQKGGVNFSLFSRHASKVTILVFSAGSKEPLIKIPLDDPSFSTRE